MYLVRLAKGDGVRKAEPMRDFAAALSKVPDPLTGSRDVIHSSRISDIENGHVEPTLSEVRRIAALDPRRRSPAWLAAFTDSDEPARHQGVTADDIPVGYSRSVRIPEPGEASVAEQKKRPVRRGRRAG